MLLSVMKGIVLVGAAAAVSAGAYAQSVTPLSVQLGAGSDCNGAALSFYGEGNGILTEGFRITSTENLEEFASSYNATSSNFSGTIQRTVNFPAEFSPSTLVAVDYKLGGSDLSDPSTGEFFVVYECSSTNTVYSCAGLDSQCPSSIEEYFPKLDYTMDDRGLLMVNDPSPKYLDVLVQNSGFAPLHIASPSLSGPNKDEFEILYGAEDSILEHGDLDYITIQFVPKTVGEKAALLTIVSNDYNSQTLEIPIQASVKAVPSLQVKIRKVSSVVENGRLTISGQIRIKNLGLISSRPGAVLSLTEAGNNFSGDNSPPRVLIKQKLKGLKPNQSINLNFRSTGHSATNSVSKNYLASISGSKLQRGLTKYNLRSVAYFDR